MSLMIKAENGHGVFSVSAPQMAEARKLLVGPQDVGRLRVHLSGATGYPVSYYRDVVTSAELLVMFADAMGA